MTKHIVFLMVEEFANLAFSCAVEPLRIANMISGEELYKWTLLSDNGKTVTCSGGIVMQVDGDFDEVPKCDQLFVLSGSNMQKHASAHLISTLRKQRAMGNPIGALCSGAWILAKAGFLDGMQAAIHWDFHDAFMEEFPEVNLVRNVFVSDEKYVTASGGTATADLMLHRVEMDHGSSLAMDVADQMVYSGARNASAEQRVSLQARNGMRNRHLAKALQIMQDTLENPISPADIAKDIGISSRQLERLFGRYLNSSPKRYHLEMRLERARHLLMQTEASVIDVAIACGFETTGHFSRVYRTAYGVSPSMQRYK
ncbi:GlxA family transcriptional regulator [Cognatishimia activa]|uniref:GlxA family transcriptional regulator n=1 Tax=Cognatishimia activa TaxID=1715691 RepID=UPI0022306EA9|nr:GlxA family transcriptional regulator [Cognatishimia activa]UZD90361.1 GlxA family transcriptional regulator [Cognatishimia activa]